MTIRKQIPLGKICAAFRKNNHKSSRREMLVEQRKGYVRVGIWYTREKQYKYAQFDDYDWERIKHLPLSVKSNIRSYGVVYYVTLRITVEGARKRFYIHRYMGISCAVGLMSDHIDGDGLNNRRRNLRSVDGHINARNTHANRLLGVAP